MRTCHEAQHRPVRVGDVHRNSEVPAVMDATMFNAELGAAIDHGRHFLCRPENDYALRQTAWQARGARVSCTAESEKRPPGR